MNKTIKSQLILIAFLFLGTIGFGQSNEIKIRYIGNCGLHITDGETHIYTDFPYQPGAYNYLEYDQSEIDNLKENAYYIFTHKHRDHYYRGKINKILKRKKGKKYGKWNISKLEKLGEVIPDFKIEAFKTKHKYSSRHYSYMITWHGKKIYLSGDTESEETIMKMKGMDWAFIPSWLVPKINATGIPLDTKKIGIYHIGPSQNINITGEKVLMLKEQGLIISIPY